MIEYPKIETLYNRDKSTFKVIPGELRWKEFGNIYEWLVTEKIDGTNIRVDYSLDGGVVIGGRTDNAQLSTNLLHYLQYTFPMEKFAVTFPDLESGSNVTLFGEGYGEKIQNGGKYRQGVSFRLFDVLFGRWWLEPLDVIDIASKLNINTVPYLGTITRLPDSTERLFDLLPVSKVANEEGGEDFVPEGIVARTQPLLLTRSGARLMWKLKFKDF